MMCGVAIVAPQCGCRRRGTPKDLPRWSGCRMTTTPACKRSSPRRRDRSRAHFIAGANLNSSFTFHISLDTWPARGSCARPVQYPRPLVRLHAGMEAASLERMTREAERRTWEVAGRERSRLLNFIRRRVPDPRDAEDILQDVMVELAEANRLLMPIEHVTGWLFRVARNRITDLLRRKKPASMSGNARVDADGERLGLTELLPSPDAGPEAL